MKQKLFKLILVIFLLTLPFGVKAAGLVPCGGDAPEKPCTVYDMFYGVARINNWLIMMAGVYAVFRFGQAGWWLTISLGNEENITTWKKALTNSVIGFVLVMLAYVLVNTAVNGILSQGKTGYTIDLTNPFKYICNGKDCPK